MPHPPQSWIKRVSHIAKEALEIPMWGNPPEFPLKTFCEKLQEKLDVDDLSVSISTADWKQPDDLLSGMGNNPLQVCFDVSPLGDSLFWVIPFEDASKLAKWSLSKTGENFSDPELIKGFYRFLLVEAIDALSESQGIGDLSLQLSEASLPSEQSYCIDVSITHESESAWGRVICPPTFQKSFKEYFAIGKGPFYTPLTPHVDIPISLNVGRVYLTHDEFSEAKEGDFILLDHCSYQPDTKKGTFTLSLDNQPLFQVKLKDEKIKILDFAHYYEDLNMDENNEEKLPPEMGEEHEAPKASEDEEHAQEGSETSEGEEHIEPEEFSEELSPAPQEEITSPKNVPLKLSVEVTRIKMTLEKLLQLKPGNVLELAVKPEQGVDLTLEGKVIARGTLLQVGDVVGVKITDLSS